MRGFTLLEVLIALLITAFGLLGLAGLMSKMQLAETEGYQRSQAMILVTDMVERINAAMPRGPADSLSTYQASDYDTGTTTPRGTGYGGSGLSDCTTVTATPAHDLCEWSNALKGAAESSSGGSQVGAMVGARGCVELLVAANNAGCKAPTDRVSVTWQGLFPSAAPNANLACGKTGTPYGSDDRYRRIIAQKVTVGLPSCIIP